MKQLKLPLEFRLLKLSDDKRYTVLNKVPLTKNSLRAPLVARKELELFFYLWLQLALLSTITVKIYFNYLSSIYQPLFTPVLHTSTYKFSSLKKANLTLIFPN